MLCAKVSAKVKYKRCVAFERHILEIALFLSINKTSSSFNETHHPRKHLWANSHFREEEQAASAAHWRCTGGLLRTSSFARCGFSVGDNWSGEEALWARGRWILHSSGNFSFVWLDGLFRATTQEATATCRRCYVAQKSRMLFLKAPALILLHAWLPNTCCIPLFVGFFKFSPIDLVF